MGSRLAWMLRRDNQASFMSPGTSDAHECDWRQGPSLLLGTWCPFPGAPAPSSPYPNSEFGSAH